MEILKRTVSYDECVSIEIKEVARKYFIVQSTVSLSNQKRRFD